MASAPAPASPLVEAVTQAAVGSPPISGGGGGGGGDGGFGEGVGGDHVDAAADASVGGSPEPRIISSKESKLGGEEGPRSPDTLVSPMS